MSIVVNQLNNDVADRFSAAASSYQAHDVLQRIAAKHLLAQMSENNAISNACLLDIGCGPGTSFSSISTIKEVIGVDIAQGMLRTLKQGFPHYSALCADAQNLPIANNAVEVIYSNVALQWCGSLAQAIAEANRVLAFCGEFYGSIVAKNSLHQLTDLGLNVNSFLSETEIQDCFVAQDWQIEHIETRAITVFFDDLKSLLQSIKGVGASTVADKSKLNQRHVTLRGRGDWQKLVNQAELRRSPEGLPLTYNISFIKARKTR
ncbi:methyltransferase domain-containing protein [Shewanella youngdeokensis]|uniref:Methyltransferase domain-containing protein n=1 Tax=Shewanella youngdeokensis TaxID=2999068 RepID=A0ABZ0JWE7_9GAMM|nr:methyltransferase domain-containing protein [Shewanella sp. DAU334]